MAEIVQSHGKIEIPQDSSSSSPDDINKRRGLQQNIDKIMAFNLEGKIRPDLEDQDHSKPQSSNNILLEMVDPFEMKHTQSQVVYPSNHEESLSPSINELRMSKENSQAVPG